MKLYTNKLSPNCRKVHAVVAHTGLTVEEITVDLQSGAHRQPDYIAINPNGKVPTLVDGDTPLWESNAIINYLASKAESDLWPKSMQRYDIMRWQFWETNHWAAAVGKLIGQYIFNKDNPDQAIIDQALEEFRRFAAVLDGRLDGRTSVSGDGLTTADYSVAVWLGYAPICKLPVGEFANISSWWETIAGSEAGKHLAPPMP